MRAFTLGHGSAIALPASRGQIGKDSVRNSRRAQRTSEPFLDHATTSVALRITMNTPTRLYWTLTGLMAAFMLMASVPDILQIPQAVALFDHLGYPVYLLPFIGIAKTLGVAAVLAPNFVRLKEWAYAGLVFDLIGALYSHIAVGDPPSAWVLPVIGLLLVTGSYVFYRKRLNDGRKSLSSILDQGAQPVGGISAR
jgi:hypothetical protein